MGLEETIRGRGLNLSASGYGTVADSGKHSNEPSVGVHEILSDCQLLKVYCAPWNKIVFRLKGK